MREIRLQGRGPNTMSLAMLERVEHELDDAGDAPLLITGEGAAFSAGLDLDELKQADAAHVARLLAVMERVTRRLYLHPAPTVACVNGHAVAGGCLLVQCCDVRVGRDDAAIRIGMTGIAIGLIYPPFVLAVFSQRLTAPQVEAVLLGAGRHPPREALALGLLDELAVGDVRARAEARLAERSALPRHGYAATKRALREPAFARGDESERVFRDEVLPSWTEKLARR